MDKFTFMAVLSQLKKNGFEVESVEKHPQTTVFHLKNQDRAMALLNDWELDSQIMAVRAYTRIVKR